MRLIGGLLVVMLGSGLAAAEPPSPAPLSSPPLQESAREVPDADKLVRSGKALAAMREMLRGLLKKLEEVRRTHDVVKLNCINDKLARIKGLLHISQGADAALQEALSRRNASASEREYTKVQLAHHKATLFRAEAEACVGQLAFHTDESLSIKVEEPENRHGGDPTRPRPPPPIIVRPPPASPVR